MSYGESNGQMTDDVTWRRKVKHVERNISKTVLELLFII